MSNDSDATTSEVCPVFTVDSVKVDVGMGQTGRQRVQVRGLLG
jgi:hypothetical protein